MALPRAWKSDAIGQLAVYGKLLLLHEAGERLPGWLSGAAYPPGTWVVNDAEIAGRGMQRYGNCKASPKHSL